MEGGEAEEQARLPLGPWLLSLKQLAANWAVLASSPEALAAAKQLEHVCITGAPDFANTPVAKRAAFWAWAATHRPLRFLSFDF